MTVSGATASIFRAYDIRGEAGVTLTAALAEQIARVIGERIGAAGGERVALGRDGRLSSPQLHQAVGNGLRDTGLEVIDIGCLPTPLLYFSALTECDGHGVMVTGSHNPPADNGIKVMVGGETLAGEAIQALYHGLADVSNSGGSSGRYRQHDAVSAYRQALWCDIQLQRPLKVVIDCGNGVAGAVAGELFSGLGCEVSELFCEVDGRFPNHHPDPGRPENLADLCREVLRQGADVGLAFDGDGDRLGVVAADGSVIWPDRLMMLFTPQVLAEQPGASVVYDVKCSAALAEVIKAHGGRPKMGPSGHSLTRRTMLEHRALLAGEYSGHLFFADRWFGIDDALYAAARLLELVAAEPDVMAPFAALPDWPATPELQVPMSEGEPHAIMQRLVAGAAAFVGGRTNTLDGLRVEYDEGWGLIRASNTTPNLVLRFEGRDRQALQNVQRRFSTTVKALQPGLALPPLTEAAATV